MCCPLPAYTPAMGGGGLHRDDLIAEYFAQGFTYKDILVALLVSHGLSVTPKTLKRTLRRLGLKWSVHWIQINVETTAKQRIGCLC